jgi:hypothetical protein
MGGGVFFLPFGLSLFTLLMNNVPDMQQMLTAQLNAASIKIVNQLLH